MSTIAASIPGPLSIPYGTSVTTDAQGEEINRFLGMKSRGTPKYPKYLQKVGTTVAEVIASRGYPSLENFALSNGFHKATVHQVVRGQVDPRLSTLIRLAEALEVPLERLVGGLGS